MKRLVERIVEGAFILGMVWLLTGCCTIKGAVRDLSWTADKMDKAIVVPK